MQAIATPSRGQRFFTNHESRVTSHETRLFFSVVRDGRLHRKPPSGPLPPPASRCFPVRHCSPLFTIVRHCSAKKCSAPVPSRRPVTVSLRPFAWHGAAMARHGRRPSPAPATGPVGFSPATRHATWFFPVPPATPGRATPSPANSFLRITSHESRLLRFPTHDFPRFPGISRYFPAPHPPGKGSASRSVAAFLRVVARHGAAMARHGRRPHRQQALLGFHQPRDTQHGFSLFLRRLQGEQPQARPTAFSRITCHESRPLCFSSHYFPAFPAILRVPPPPGTGVRAPSAVAPAALKAASAAANVR